MIHPDPQIQRNQQDFLNRFPLNEREHHASLFRIGNAAVIYHQMAEETSLPKLELYYHEWLEALPSNIRESMEKRGFEECKRILSFTRYINERNDFGMDEWMKSNLSEEDYKFYKRQ
ncbi:MAG: hypothetical protein LBI82_12915 [Dysgonamonadaceae bacterium]|jgi:hypothetical protein|nr:hypothetical protein [Dysgonamonadaceae bacterium]